MRSWPERMRGGLTLIEVLIVITVVLLLAGLVLPVVGTVRACAKRCGCANNLRQLGAVTMLYADEHEGLAPGSRVWGVQDHERSIAWFYRLPPYLHQAEIGTGRSIFQCAAFTWSGPRAFAHEVPKSFKMNANLDSDHGRYQPFMLDGVSDAASVVLFIDGNTGTGMGQWGHAPPSAVDDSRHPGAVNVLFADGHGQSVVRTPPHRRWTAAVKWSSDEWRGR